MPQPTSNTVQTNAGNSVTSLTVSGYTRRANDNYALVRVAWRRNSVQNLTSVTYGGNAMTQIGANLDTAGVRIATYGLSNPPSGAQNVVGTWDVACSPAMAVATYDDVASVGTPTTNTSTTANLSSSVTAAADTLYAAVGAIRSGTEATTTATGSQTVEAEVNTSTPIVMVVARLGATGTIAWNEPNFFVGSGQIVVPLVGTAGGGGAARAMHHYRLRRTA